MLWSFAFLCVSLYVNVFFFTKLFVSKWIRRNVLRVHVTIATVFSNNFDHQAHVCSTALHVQTGRCTQDITICIGVFLFCCLEKWVHCTLCIFAWVLIKMCEMETRKSIHKRNLHSSSCRFLIFFLVLSHMTCFSLSFSNQCTILTLTRYENLTIIAEKKICRKNKSWTKLDHQHHHGIPLSKFKLKNNC